VQRTIAGETILVPVRGGIADVMNLYVLNPTALALWELLETPRTLEELAEHLTRSTDGEAGEVQRDCREFLQRMEELGLVESL